MIENNGLHDTALYCSTFKDTRDGEDPAEEGLLYERQMKARIRLIPGSFPLPEENGTYQPFFLPVCFDMEDNQLLPESSGIGTITTNHGPTKYRFTIEQPMRIGLESFVLRMVLDPAKSGTVLSQVLNGNSDDPARIQLCPPEGCVGNDAYTFESCHFVPVEKRRDHHQVVFLRDSFQAGWVNLRIRIKDCPGICVGTMSGIHWQAEGQLDNETFDQQEYYKLVYHPQHHHMLRHFAILFHNSIGGACGLKITGIQPSSTEVDVSVSSIDCQLNPIESFVVESVNFFQGE
jgi:hypothetical protein